MDAAAWYKKGKVAYKTKNYEEALASYDRAIELDAKYAAPWNGKGNVYAALNRYEEALSSYDRAIELDAEYAYPWNGKGIVFHKLNRYEEALASYKRAIELDAEDAYPWNGKGIVYDDLNRYEEALASYDRAIELDAEYSAPWNGKGIVFRILNRYEEALASYDRAIELDAEDAYPWNGKGIVFHKLNRYEEALSSYDRAIELDAEDAYPWNGKGIVYDDLNRYEEALASYDRAIELDAEYAAPWNGKGIVFRILNRYEEALASYDRAIELDAEYAAPWNGKGNVYDHLNRYEEALASYDRAIELDAELAYPWDGKGNVFRKLNRYEEALSSYDRAIELDVEDAVPWNGKAIVYFHLNKLGEDNWVALQSCALRAEYLRVPSKSNLFILFSNSTILPYFARRITTQYLLPHQFNRFRLFIETAAAACKNLTLYTEYVANRFYSEITPANRTKWEGLLEYYMGDYIVAYEVFREAAVAGNDLMLYYYACLAGEKFYERDDAFWARGLVLAENYAQAERRGIQSWFTGNRGKPLEQVLQIYYAGQLFVLAERWEDALVCFQRVAKNFRPAAYMDMWVSQRVGQSSDSNNKAKKLLEAEQHQPQFCKNIPPQYLDLDKADFFTPFIAYARYAEISDAIEVLYHQAKAKGIAFDSPRTQKAFHELWRLRPEDEKRIHEQQRDKWYRAFFESFFAQTLEPLSAQQRAQMSVAEFEEKVLQRRDYELVKDFRYLQQEAERGPVKPYLGGLIEGRKYSLETHQALIHYFLLSDQLTAKDHWLLVFYAILRDKDNRQVSAILLAGAKGGVKDFLKRIIPSSVGAGLGSLLGFVNPVLGFTSAFAASALAELLAEYWKKERPTFENFTAFEEQFAAFIGAERAKLGEERFFERYPVRELL